MPEKNFGTQSLNKHSSAATAFIFCAGLGSRLKPWTDRHPKALAVVNGKSLLQRNVEYLQHHRIINVVVNVHHFANQIVEAINTHKGWGSNIVVSDETATLLETGGGLLKAAPLFHDANTIVLLNVDILTDMNLNAMLGYHAEKKPLATLSTTNRNTTRYFLFDEGNNLCGWRNVSTGEERTARALNGKEAAKAFSGIHVIESKLLSLISQKGKFSIVDVYLDLMKVHTIKSFDHSGSKLIDVGKPDSIVKAEALFS